MHPRTTLCTREKSKKCRPVFCSDAWVGSIGIAIFLFHQARALVGARPKTTLEKGVRFFFLEKKKAARFAHVYRVVQSLCNPVTTCISEDACINGGSFNRSALAKYDRMFFSLHQVTTKTKGF